MIKNEINYEPGAFSDWMLDNCYDSQPRHVRDALWECWQAAIDARETNTND